MCCAFIPFIMVLETMILIDNIAFSSRFFRKSTLKHICLLLTFVFSVYLRFIKEKHYVLFNIVEPSGVSTIGFGTIGRHTAM